jgi:soluble lytic murein transglycosylase-like protein
MQMVNIISMSIIGLCLILNTLNPNIDSKINQTAKASVNKKAQDVWLENKLKVQQFIKLVQPKYSVSYIKKITELIFKYAEKYRLDPYILVTTAYLESDFNMKSQPCIGMMQILYSTYKSDYYKTGYNPYTLEGNIALGALELSDHLYSQKVVDRSKVLDRHRAFMFGRYNGSGRNSRYTKKAMTTLSRIKTESISKLKDRMKKGKV